MYMCAQVTNWQHPRFHAFFPVATSHAGTIGNLLGRMISSVGFSWVRLCSGPSFRSPFRLTLTH